MKQSKEWQAEQDIDQAYQHGTEMFAVIGNGFREGRGGLICGDLNDRIVELCDNEAEAVAYAHNHASETCVGYIVARIKVLSRFEVFPEHDKVKYKPVTVKQFSF